ncbi:MAG: putative glycoside hydrolase [bacterium]
MKNTLAQYKHILFVCVGIISAIIFFFVLPKIFTGHYVLTGSAVATLTQSADVKKDVTPVFVPTYIATPVPVKGIYMTSWTAGTPSLRGALVKLIDDTELNTVVIDIKDYSGKIVFPIENTDLKKFGSEEVRVSDMRDFVESLHKKGIYVIGRIAVFQDAYFVKYKPDLAVKNKAGTAVWKDRKGISWIDPGSQEYWDYIVLLAQETRKVGFDEINFDYIRFPSDGNMQDISYPFSSTTPKTVVMKNFFAYVTEHLKKGVASSSAPELKISADLFGMVTTAQDDMGIGQYLENALPYFDYIMPMVYPSHYPPTFIGYKNPEAYPYEVVKYAMSEAVKRANLASTSPAKLRPWLQDFGLKMTYGSAEVRAQIKATNDVGLDSWILWSASNKYTKGALDAK